MKEKKKNPLFLGILSIILGLLFSWGGYWFKYYQFIVC